MTTDELLRKIQTDPDFVNLKRFDYSLKKVLERYPEGVPNDRVIAQALMISEDDVAAIYAEILSKLRSELS